MFQNRELLLVQQTATFFLFAEQKGFIFACYVEPIHLLALTFWQQHAVTFCWKMV